MLAPRFHLPFTIVSIHASHEFMYIHRSAVLFCTSLLLCHPLSLLHLPVISLLVYFSWIHDAFRRKYFREQYIFTRKKNSLFRRELLPSQRQEAASSRQLRVFQRQLIFLSLTRCPSRAQHIRYLVWSSQFLSWETGHWWLVSTPVQMHNWDAHGMTMVSKLQIAFYQWTST